MIERLRLAGRLVLLTLLSAASLRAATLPMENQPWVRVDTEGVAVFSNAEPRRALILSEDLEALRRALGELTTLSGLTPVPTRIFLFSTDRSMIPYKHRYQGEPASISGAFYSRPYGDYILVNGAKRQEARLTIYHEYMHAVLRSHLPDLPLWLEEGLAELFSTFEKVDGAYRIGRPLKRHLNELAKGEPLALAELFRLDVTSPRYHEFDKQGELYARSWELVHYLLLGNETRRAHMLRFLHLTFGGMEQEQAFKTAFGGAHEVLDKELAEYREKSFEPRVVDLEPIRPDLFKLRSVPYPQILVHLGDLLIAQGDRERDAVFHFEEALRRNPQNGAAVAGLGLVAAETREYAKARALFRKAVQAAPTDARLHYHYGASLLVLGRGAAASKRQEAHGHLRRSVELHPDFGPAWAGLAESLELIDTSSDARSPEGKSVGAEKELLPEGDEVLRLLLFYVRNQQRSEAETLFDKYFESEPPAGPKARARRLAAERILTGLTWLEGKDEAEDFDLVP